MDPKAIKKQISEARKKRENGQFAEALDILHRLSDEFNGVAQYRYLLALTYFDSWKEELALKYAEEAILLDPHDKDPYELIGDIYTRQENFKRALGYYEKAHQLDEKNAYLEQKLIQGYIKEKDYEKLLAACNHLLSHVPIDVATTKARILTAIYSGTILYKTWALISLKRYEAAIAEFQYRRAVHQETRMPSYPNQYKDDDESLFKIYYKLGNVAQADFYRSLLKEQYQLQDVAIKDLEEEAQNNILLKQQKYGLI